MASHTDILDSTSLAVLDAVVARLIPSDDLGPGAREAGVSRYILRALASDYAEFAERYRAGLAAFETCAETRHSRGFAALSPAEQDAILVDAEAGRLEPDPSEAFFALLRQHAMEGMFGDPHWGGNADQAGWRLLGYPGPKLVWTAEEQQIETL